MQWMKNITLDPRLSPERRILSERNVKGHPPNECPRFFPTDVTYFLNAVSCNVAYTKLKLWMVFHKIVVGTIK